MPIWLKQSTAVVISFGPFVLNTDGVTLVTNLVGTGANQTESTTTGIRISKNGGAFAARHAPAAASTYDAYGNYLVTLDTTDTGTLGVLRVQFVDAAHFCPVWQDFEIVAANVYDSLIGGGDVLDVSTIQLAGQTVTAAAGVTFPTSVASPTNITAASGVALAAGQKVDVDTIKTNPVVNGGTVTFPTNSTLASTTNITGASGVALAAGQKVDVDTIKTNPVVNAGTVTFPTDATLASTTNITAASGVALAADQAVNATKWAGGIIPAPNVTGVPKVDLTDIDGQATNGNNATLNLKKLNISNQNDYAIQVETQNTDAVLIRDTAGNGYGLRLSGNSNGGAGGGLICDGASFVDSPMGDGIAMIISGANTGLYVEGYNGGKSIDAPNNIAVSDGNLTLAAIANAVWTNASRTLTSFGTLVADIADAVWDELIASHLGAGSTGEKLNSAGAAGDPWSTALPGAYGAGTAGNIVGTNLDTTVSSRSTLTAADVWDALLTGIATVGSIGKLIKDYLDAAISSRSTYAGGAVSSVTAPVTVGTNNDKTGYGLADGAITAAKIATDAIDADALAADAITEIQSGLSTLNAAGVRTAVGLASANLDTQLSNINAKTTNLPANPSAVGDIPTANQNADALLDRVNGVETGFTLRQSLRLVLSSVVAKLSGAATANVKIRDINDTKTRIDATVDADGNRTNVTTDVS